MKYNDIQRQQAKSLIEDFGPLFDRINFKPAEDEQKIRMILSKGVHEMTDKDVDSAIELYDKYFKNDELRKHYHKG
jgi:hypothetical protein